jgi:hypothetical protein
MSEPSAVMAALGAFLNAGNFTFSMGARFGEGIQCAPLMKQDVEQVTMLPWAHLMQTSTH